MKQLIRKLTRQTKYRVIERDPTNQQHVTGTTLINHKIRLKLGLTLREYVVCDFIHSYIYETKKARTFGEWFKGTGFYPRMIHLTYERLLNKGVLFKDTDGMVKTTVMWNKHFPNDRENFNQIWRLHNVGNKQQAQKVFIASCKVDTFENILKGTERYVEWLKESDQFPMHTSTFLNPNYKRWNDERDISKYKKKIEVLVVPDTNPKSAW